MDILGFNISTFAIALTVFVGSFAVIVSEKIHRTTIAVFGAVLMVLLGVLNQEMAIHGIDFNTLGLLVGMMVIVAISKNSGIFQYVALWFARFAKGDPMKILIYFGLITAIFSALLDNVTTVLLMVPVTFVITNHLKISPMPYLITIILLSNIGGAATLIGDPPNIIIGSAAGFSFMDFVYNLGPVVVVISAVTLLLVKFVFAKRMKTTEEAKQKILSFNPKDAITDVPLLIRSLIALGVTILLFVMHGFLHLEAATVALAGAAFLLMMTLDHPEHCLKEVEWVTIFFFAGLFVLVAGIEHVGLIEMAAEGMIDLTGGDNTKLVFATLWGGAFFSAIVDNIPFVTAMSPLIQSLGERGFEITTLWWALALGADIGGNGSLVGASANLVVAGMAEKDGHKLGFKEFLKYGPAFTLVAMIIATAYVWFRYL